MAEGEVHRKMLLLLIIMLKLIAINESADVHECTKHYKRFRNGTYLYEGVEVSAVEIKSINCSSKTPGKSVYTLCPFEGDSCKYLCLERFEFFDALCNIENEIENRFEEYSFGYNANWIIDENGAVHQLSNGDSPFCFEYNETGIDETAFRKCVPTELTITELLNSWAMLISIPFLLVTILVYAFIPQLLNLHGKCLLCYLISIVTGYTGLSSMNLFSSSLPKWSCMLLGFSLLFVLLAAFFWLSVISFDLWRNFRGNSRKVKKSMQMSRFYAYSLYAWGIPIVITTLAYLAEISSMDDVYKPGINGIFCWLNTDIGNSALIYFYGPNLVLTVLIIAMYISIAYKIYVVRKGLNMFDVNDKNSQHQRSQRDNFWLFFRLFIIMGVSWLMEVLSYLFQAYKDSIGFLFVATDLYNGMQGIIVFTLLVMRPKVLRLIKNKFKPEENQSDCKYKLSSVSSE